MPTPPSKAYPLLTQRQEAGESRLSTRRLMNRFTDGTRHTCFVLQDDDSRLIDAEHIVDNVLAAHVGQI